MENFDKNKEIINSSGTLAFFSLLHNSSKFLIFKSYHGNKSQKIAYAFKFECGISQKKNHIVRTVSDEKKVIKIYSKVRAIFTKKNLSILKVDVCVSISRMISKCALLENLYVSLE